MNNPRNVIVTGATSGVGLALIPLLKEKGYQPILTGRNAEKVQNYAAEQQVPGYVLDVSDTGSIPSVIEEIEKENGPIFGLINNAGIWLEGEFATNKPEDIHDVVNCNMMGTMMATHAVLPDLAERGTGFIFNVVSTGALYTRKNISVYAASKWAIRGFTGCLEAEYAPKGVRVMGFYPGKISSEMYTTAGVPRDLEIAMTPHQAAEMIIMMITHENMVWSHVSGRSLSDYV
ncbi:SDR family NAD(P)-dependent oxidoreductase [Curvivirga sp.]|uniref:SDR family NAD(P)-dependent oxidoreductase n=1 Tax=Curvivirga sp. TaxID=2856848 RepID=UPI003B59A802